MRRWSALLAGAAAVAFGTLAIGYYWVLQNRTAPPPSFKQLTFRRGVVHTARFAPDGHTIVYGAGWDGNPSQVFSSRLEGPESKPLDVPDGNVASISPSGELAMLTGRMYLTGMPPRTLVRVPLAGGAPREVAETSSGPTGLLTGAVWPWPALNMGGPPAPRRRRTNGSGGNNGSSSRSGRCSTRAALPGSGRRASPPTGTRSRSSRSGRIAALSRWSTSRVERRRSRAVRNHGDSRGLRKEMKSGSRSGGRSGRSALPASAGWSHASPERSRSTISPATDVSS